MQKLSQIQNISFIGSGNVATHLALAFKNIGLSIADVYSPTQENATHLAKLTGARAVGSYDDLDVDIDLILICVPDAKVDVVFNQLPNVNGIIAHTSGITSIEIVSQAKHFGVFYPLQTFSRTKVLDLGAVPFCIEGSDVNTSESLAALAERLSQNVKMINSEERKYLHLTAVMVNNFTNHLYHVADDILKNKGIDFKLLLPLIKETSDKIELLEPHSAQTGPAKRDDQTTIEMHTDMLQNNPDYKELYRLISEQINTKYHG